MKTFKILTLSFSSDSSVTPKFGAKAQLNLVNHPASGYLSIDDSSKLSGQVIVFGTFSGTAARAVTCNLFLQMQSLGNFRIGNSPKGMVRDISAKSDSYEIETFGQNLRRITYKEMNKRTGKTILLEFEVKKL